MARSGERGTGSVYRPKTRRIPVRSWGRTGFPTTWTASAGVSRRRSRKKYRAQALLKRAHGEHPLGLELEDEAKRRHRTGCGCPGVNGWDRPRMGWMQGGASLRRTGRPGRGAAPRAGASSWRRS
jgi:hypothetical protein